MTTPKRKKETLAQRVAKLEYLVYRQYVEECPRCHEKAMNAWQKGICNMCAYKKGDSL